MFQQLLTIALAGLLPASALMADFSYVQTTRVTGGQIAGMMRMARGLSGRGNQPDTTTHYVKGDKMATVSSTHASIVDLAAETITEVDFQKKSYTVMTFAEMKQMMEQVAGKSGVEDMNFKVSASPTGVTRKVSGVDAKEIVITMEMEMTDQKTGHAGTMKITTDTWIASDISGYEEVRAFYRKMGAKINWTPGSGSAMMGRQDMVKGMDRVAKEMAKLDGVPVLQVMKMGGASDGQEMPQLTAEQQAQADSARAQAAQQSQASPSASSAIAGALGIPKFGGFGKKKPAEQPQQAAPTSAANGTPSSDPSVLMETTIESSGFSSSDVDATRLEVPAGFKKVDSPRMGR